MGWISRGRKDRGFGWVKIRDGGEQLFYFKPGQKSGMEESGKQKTVGNRHMRSVERRGMGWGTRGKQDGHVRDFQ